jgi:hypothetical protein
MTDGQRGWVIAGAITLTYIIGDILKWSLPISMAVGLGAALATRAVLAVWRRQ